MVALKRPESLQTGMQIACLNMETGGNTEVALLQSRFLHPLTHMIRYLVLSESVEHCLARHLTHQADIFFWVDMHMICISQMNYHFFN